MRTSSLTAAFALALLQILPHTVDATPAPGVAAILYARWYNAIGHLDPRSRLLCLPGITDEICDDKCTAAGFYQGVCGLK